MSLQLLTNPHLVAAVSIVLSLSPGVYFNSVTEQSTNKIGGRDVSPILVVLAYCAIFWHFVLIMYYLTSLLYSRHHFRCKTKPWSKSTLPGVSVLKPLMGVDSLQDENLESFFLLDYPKYELLFGVQDKHDPVVDRVKYLCKKYPDVDAKYFIGGKEGIINPLVMNTVPQYENAKYDVMWFASSRIKASTEIMVDLVNTLMIPNTGLAYQLPFVLNRKGHVAVIEKIFFGCYLTRIYLTHLVLNLSCIMGMSYMFRKSDLDSLNGLEWYGRYLMEDFYIAQALHDKGYSIRASTIPAQQNAECNDIHTFRDRSLRWLKLRIFSVPLSTLFVEPTTYVTCNGVCTAWAVWLLFRWNPLLYFCIHEVTCCLLDYAQLRGVQKGPLPFSLREYIQAWLEMEYIHVAVFLQALSNPRTTLWGDKMYTLLLGGLTKFTMRPDHNQNGKKNAR